MDQDNLFTPIESKRTFEEISSKVKTLIFDGTLKPGDKLPSELELAKQFGVGRQSVREALRLPLAGGLHPRVNGLGWLAGLQIRQFLVLDAGHVDVRSKYGAAGDGVTDDTAAIQKAISENLDYHSKILYFPAGTYLISDTLMTKKVSGEPHFGQKPSSMRSITC